MEWSESESTPEQRERAAKVSERIQAIVDKLSGGLSGDRQALATELIALMAWEQRPKSRHL